MILSDPVHAWIAAAAVVLSVPAFGAIIGAVVWFHDRRAQERTSKIVDAIQSAQRSYVDGVERVHKFHLDVARQYSRVEDQYRRVEKESKERDDHLGERITVLEAKCGDDGK